MQQSNVIFANLFIAYFLFITAKGELGSYLDLLKGGGQQTNTSTSDTNANGNAANYNGASFQGSPDVNALYNVNPSLNVIDSNISDAFNPGYGSNVTDYLTQLTGG